MILTNKHFIATLIVTPILSVIGYFAADYLVAERPHQANSGGRYPLVQSPDCRYASGQCSLRNGNFKVVIAGGTDHNGDFSLHLESVFALDTILVSVVGDVAEIANPIAMQPLSDDGKSWQLSLYAPDRQYMRLVVTVAGAVYYAESGMAFLNGEAPVKRGTRQADIRSSPTGS